MSASTSAPSAPPTRRDLKSPYFLFRTPDGTGSYFTGENLPIVMSPKEPLSRFLAPARTVESGTLRSIAYDLDAVPLDTARPLEFLPQSEIDAFALAVAAFYDKAHALTPRIVPHEKRLRAHFRLPDPDLERDAYWVYGPVHDRRLLILWGCEFKTGTSLLLAPDEELKIPAGRTIVDRLQARVMTWELRQREALKLALDNNEPISQFLARPAVDASGQSAGVAVKGQTIAPKNLKPLGRVLTSQCKAFEKAARQFYDKAAASGTTAYEKELRCAFRLSNPDKNPAAFQLHGKSLLVVVDGKETFDGTLPLADHPVLASAAAPTAAPAAAVSDGPVVVATGGTVGATVAAKLFARSVPSWRGPALMAAAVVLLAGGGFAVWKLLPDRAPPKLVDYDKEHPVLVPDSTHVLVRFSEPILAASIKRDAKGSSISFDGKAEVVGTPEPGDARDPNAANIVRITTSKLADGESYRLVVKGVTDLAGNALPPTAPIDFKFFDTIPPEIAVFSSGELKGKPMISAAENKNQLKIVFTKELDKDSLLSGRAVVTSVDNSITLTSKPDLDDKTNRTVIFEGTKDFSDVIDYKLESVAGLKDTAKHPNPIAVPATGVPFAFRDVLPPRIKDRAASAGRLQLTLTFTKPVDKAIAEDVGNYSATAPDNKTPLEFVPGSAHLNDQGNVLTLRLAPAKLGEGRYRLVAKNIRDKNKNTSPLLEETFEFSDAGDRSPLVLTTVGKVTGNQMKLEFSRVITPADANDRSKFQLTDDQQRPISGLSITQVQRVPDNPTQVLLTLSKEPPGGTRMLVTATGITDIFGVKQDQPVRLAKPVTITGVSAPVEQVLAWIGRPALKGNTVTLTVKEEVSRTTAQNLDNYEFTPDSVRATKATMKVETDAKSGTRRTIITLVLQSPLLSPSGVKLSAHDLEAEGLAFLGPQALDAVELVAAP